MKLGTRGVSPTLNSFDNGGESRATVLIFENRHDEGVRISSDGICPTIRTAYGTGGGNVPMVFPIDDAREIEKFQNGTGIGEAGAPAYTLDTRQESAVAVVETLQSMDHKGLNHEGAKDGKAIVTSPSTVRRLTPMECERLQGFPDRWTDGQMDRLIVIVTSKWVTRSRCQLLNG